MAPTSFNVQSEVFTVHTTETPRSLVYSLARMPREINGRIAEFLDHESLIRLCTTCSPLRQLLRDNGNTLWKALHDTYWSSGKRFRCDRPPSRRLAGGIIVVDDSLNWQVEFVRRFTLDKGVPERLAGLRLMFHRTHETGLRNGLLTALVQDGADIYNKLKRLCKDPVYSLEAKEVLVGINEMEAFDDWQKLCDTALAANGDTVGFENEMMVSSKLFQSPEDLIRRHSSDEIYDKINLLMGGLAWEDLTDFVCIETFDGGMDTFHLDKVLKTRRGLVYSVDIIRHRVAGIPLPDRTVEWWQAKRDAFHRVLQTAVGV